MKTKLLFVLVGILVAAAMIFTGCPDEDPKVIKVTGVEIHAGGERIHSLNLKDPTDDESSYPDSVNLSVKILPAKAKSEVKWSIEGDDDGEIVTISSSGVVSSVGPGEAHIVVTTVNGKKKDSIPVKVYNIGEMEVLVQTVAIKLPGGFDAGAAQQLTVGNELQLTAAITPTNATFQDVTWDSSDKTKATISSTGLINALQAGTTTISVETAGTTVEGSSVPATASFLLTVKAPGDGVDPSEYLLILNKNETTAAGTTTNLTTAYNSTTKRLTINNNEPDGRVWAGESADGDNGVVGATLVYFKDLLGTNASISARVRLTKKNEGTTASSVESQVVMGFMNGIDTTNVRFMGIRVNAAGQWRAYHSRNGTNSSAALTGVGYTEGAASVSQIASVAIPFDEEFILEVVRGTGNEGRAPRTMTVYLKDTVTGATIASVARDNANDFNVDPAYAGFIVANVEVEISQITVREAALQSDLALPASIKFSSDASSPIPAKPASIILSGATIDGEYPEYTETHPTANGTSLAVTASVLPARAPQNIIWGVTTNASLASQSNTGVTVNGLDDTEVVVLTATAGTAVATLTITVTSGAIPVTELEIKEKDKKTSIMAGDGGGTPAETLAFECEVHPHTATNQNYTWKVYNAAIGTTEATIVAIDANGIVTIAETVTDPTDVWVVAIPSDTSLVTESNRVQITVKPYSAAPTGPYLISVKVGPSTDTATFSYNSETSELTIRGNGTFNNSTVQTDMHLVYLSTPVSAANFEAQVDLILTGSSLGDTNNNSRMGLIVFGRDPALFPVDRSPYGMVYRRGNFTSALNRTQKTSVGGANSGGSTLGTAPSVAEGSVDTWERYGISRNTTSSNNYNFSQAFQYAAGGTGGAGNAGITGTEVWVGFYVASNTSTNSVAVLKDFKVKSAGVDITFDLGNVVTGTTPIEEP